jgi:hypothetical protein
MAQPPPSPIPHTWTLPRAIAARLGDGPGRQRAMAADGHLLLVLHQPPEPGHRDRVGRLFWRSPDGFWRDSGGNHGPEEVRRLVDAYRTAVEAVEARIAGDEASAEACFQALRAGRPLHRSARNLHAAVQEARTLVDDPALIRLRDAAAAVERSAELAMAEAQAGLDYAVARQVADHARAQHRLNILAAIFLPVTAIGTVLGMNLHSGLENGPAVWFWAATAAAVAAGFVVLAAVRR